MFSEVNNSLEAMGLVQYLLVLLFLMSYPLALTQFAGPQGRRYAALLALAAAVGFVTATDPWEHGVLLVAVAVLAMGLFAAAVWLLHTLLAPLQWQAQRAPAQAAAHAQVPLTAVLQESPAGDRRKASRPGVLPIA
jgi:hypothetical protein